MKKRFCFACLSVCLGLVGMGIFSLGAGDTRLAKAETGAATYDKELVTQVILGVGADETQRNLSWMSQTSEKSVVQVAPKKAVVDDEFPTEYETFSSVSVKATKKTGYYAYDATITGLAENTEYVYRIFSDDSFSDVYAFETGSFGDYEFVFVGDPQLQLKTEGIHWQRTLQKIESEFNPTFMISAGDQICHYQDEREEEEYGYFIVEEMAATAFAPTAGINHDGPSPVYSEHYNVPNESEKYGADTKGTTGDYWFTYNNTLFMNLNLVDTGAANNGEHKKFMQETMAANPDAIWNVVIMHTSLFSSGSHSDPASDGYSGDVGMYRKTLAPVFTELGIDVVLSGHDHVYVRSHLMDGDKVSDDEVVDGEVTDPKGTLYLCANSSTGTKFYDKKVTDEQGYYIAKDDYTKRKSAIKFQVTDENITFNAYYLDTMEIFDTFTVNKTPHVCGDLEEVKAKETSCASAGKQAYFLCACGKAYEDEQATKKIEDLATWGLIPKLEHEFGEATCTSPKTCVKCGETSGSMLGHQAKEEWSMDDKYHWKDCTRCDGKGRGKEKHKDANKDGVCDVCAHGKEESSNVTSSENTSSKEDNASSENATSSETVTSSKDESLVSAERVPGSETLVELGGCNSSMSALAGLPILVLGAGAVLIKGRKKRQ